MSVAQFGNRPPKPQPGDESPDRQGNQGVRGGRPESGGYYEPERYERACTPPGPIPQVAKNKTADRHADQARGQHHAESGFFEIPFCTQCRGDEADDLNVIPVENHCREREYGHRDWQAPIARVVDDIDYVNDWFHGLPQRKLLRFFAESTLCVKMTVLLASNQPSP